MKICREPQIPVLFVKIGVSRIYKTATLAALQPQNSWEAICGQVTDIHVCTYFHNFAYFRKVLLILLISFNLSF